MSEPIRGSRGCKGAGQAGRLSVADGWLAEARKGGIPYYDWEVKNGQIKSNSRPKWPDWLLDLFGVDYFGDVVALEGRGPRLSDAELRHIEHPGRLEFINFNGSSVTDAGLVHLGPLNRIKLLQHIVDLGCGWSAGSR
jgi:hypothetical protein